MVDLQLSFWKKLLKRICGILFPVACHFTSSSVEVRFLLVTGEQMPVPLRCQQTSITGCPVLSPPFISPVINVKIFCQRQPHPFRYSFNQFLNPIKLIKFITGGWMRSRHWINQSWISIWLCMVYALNKSMDAFDILRGGIASYGLSWNGIPEFWVINEKKKRLTSSQRSVPLRTGYDVPATTLMLGCFFDWR